MRASLPPRCLPALLLAATALCSGCAGLGDAAQVATGFSAHLLCDDVLITGREPELAFAERIAPMPGLGRLTGLMRREVDRERQEVRVSWGGRFASVARWRPGLGCAVLPAGEAEALDAAVPALPALPPDAFGPAEVTAAEPRLQAALASALAGAGEPGRHRTKAVLVLREGRLLGEAYAPGYGPDTPALGFSASKSVTNALIGILVRQGRLSLQQRAPIPEWADAADPRHAITLEQLLRQTTGLAFRQDNSGFDLNARVMYTVRDKAAVAAAQPLAREPGGLWNYSDLHYLLLGRILRDAVGGRAADVQRFARDELFGPLGMRGAQFDVDTTGTPIGASHLSATARDWARLGQLFLDDGVAGGRRLLPEGWVGWSTTPTLATGYGAGWWTNRVPGDVPGWGVPWGLASAPADAFFARGFMGQFVVVIPSRRLVIVRIAVTQERGDDIVETDRIVGELLAALR